LGDPKLPNHPSFYHASYASMVLAIVDKFVI